jgi:hypothetical protein
MIAQNMSKAAARRSKNSTKRDALRQNIECIKPAQTKMDLKLAFPLSFTVTAIGTLDLLQIPYRAFVVQTLLSGTNFTKRYKLSRHNSGHCVSRESQIQMPRGLSAPKTVLSLVWM